MTIRLTRVAAPVVALGLLVAACSSDKPTAPAPTDSAAFDQLVAAAKAEGTVIVSGPRGLPDLQTVLTTEFTDKYGITVQYSGDGASAVLKKLEDVKAGDAYPYDVLVGGYDTLFANVGTQLAALDDLLVLPEVKDTSKWEDNTIPWDDAAHKSIGFLSQSGQYFYLDTSKASLADITSYRDLLKPEFKGQILLSGDPREDGTANAVMALFMQSKDLGADFVKQFLTEASPVIAASDDEVDADIKNPTFTICVCNNSQGTELLQEHPNFAKLDPHKVKEGTSTTSSFANLGVPWHVQHPNAAKLYANWILSKDAELAISKATGLPSQRTDVAKDFIAAQSIPDPSWPSGSNESALDEKQAAKDVAVEVLGKLDS